MDEPIRILHITEMLSAAGIESFIMNMYRNIDRTKVQFDFLVLRNQEEFYDDEIKSLGGHKYYVHSNKRNTLLRVLDESKQIETFLKNHPYNIVHIHYTTPLRAPYLLAAKKAGVPIRIYHAHSAAVSGKSKLKLLIYDYYRNKISDWGTDFFACSKAAAEWIYPKKLITNNKVKILYNGIDTIRFKYNPEKRKVIRDELNLEESFTIIHTGRFIDQKNQTFLVKVFAQIKTRYQDSKLLLLGAGETVNDVKKLVKELDLINDVIFLGVKSNVEDYLSAADCYVMPSLYEGLPVAAIEAQCSGLPCIFSTNITSEVKIANNVKFMSLNESETNWSNEICKFRDCIREDGSTAVNEHGYNVKDVSDKLEYFYINNINR